MPNIVTIPSYTTARLALVDVRPCHREGCGLRGVWIDNLDGSGNVVASSGYRLGAQQLLTSPGTGGFRAAVRDYNGMWSELSSIIAASINFFSAGTVEGSIGSGAQSDLDIQTPGIAFPDLAQGSSRMAVHRTLVSPGFVDETRTAGAPSGKAAFSVKFDTLDSDDGRLVHRLWRATQGGQSPWFFDYVEPSLPLAHDADIYSPSAYSDAIIADYPLAYYRLNDSSTAMASDSTNHGVTGSYSGSVTLGQPGPIAYDPTSKSVIFSGGEVSIGGSADSGGAYTFEAWVKASGSQFGMIVASGSNPYLAIDGTQAFVGFSTGLGPAGPSVVDGNWHHLVCACTAGGLMTLYVDGVSVGSLTASAPVATSTFLGAFTGGGGFNLSGSLSEVAIYTHALSSEQVARHYAIAKATLRPRTATRTTAASKRYLVKFRDQKLADSVHSPDIYEFQFSLVEVNDCPSGGNTYEPRSPQSVDLNTVVAQANFIDTRFQFEPDGALDASPKWKVADTTTGEIFVTANDGAPTTIASASTSSARTLYGTDANRIHQRVSIECKLTASGTSQAGVVLRYKNSTNFIFAYVGSDSSFYAYEVIAGTPVARVNTTVAFGGVNAISGVQIEVVDARLRWWFERDQGVQDRPPDGAADLTGTYDSSHSGWGVHFLGTGFQISRFQATETPAAVMPPPMVVPRAANGELNLAPVTLSLSTDQTGTWIDWEMLPADSGDIPEPYRARTPIATTTHTVHVRPGYSYLARARVNGTPWSEYVQVMTGSASATAWESKPWQELNWPVQDYETDGTQPAADYDFPAILPDYVLEGSDDSATKSMVSNTGRDTASSQQVRSRRTFKLVFDNRGAAQYQVLIDFFEFCRARVMPFNWTHPITGETFVLSFAADDYERIDKHHSVELGSSIASISFPCVESPPDGAVVPGYSVGLQLDTNAFTATYPTDDEIWS